MKIEGDGVFRFIKFSYHIKFNLTKEVKALAQW